MVEHDGQHGSDPVADGQREYLNRQVLARAIKRARMLERDIHWRTYLPIAHTKLHLGTGDRSTHRCMSAVEASLYAGVEPAASHARGCWPPQESHGIGHQVCG